jgi:SAM-dependent methyltransferase
LLPRLPAVEERVVGGAVPHYDLSYRDAFWSSRAYEDRCDRLALRALLPKDGGRLLELGAGFGRLIDEYRDFSRVTLVDASPAMLAAARDRVAGMAGVEVLRANATRLPIPDRSVDVVVAVRLLVHFSDPGDLFSEVERILRPGGTFILEYANRRHLLSVLRHLAGRQAWSPTSRAPIEYLDGHFAHQPATIDSQLRAAGLTPDRHRAASLFRSALLKRLVSARVLAAMESPLQGPVGRLAISPSMYVRSIPPIRSTIERVVATGVRAYASEEIDCES